MAESVRFENPKQQAVSRQSRLVKRVSPNAYIVGTFVAAAVVFGWFYRDALGLDSGTGLGYWLGIVGASMMVILLGYPLRKRDPGIPGSVQAWFRIHMALGLIGPLLVLYHAGFSWRALNSGVALWAMILVVISGLVGRYLHGHVYSRHSLRHREAGEIMDELRRQRSRLDADGALGRSAEAKLEQFRELVSNPRRRLGRAIFAATRLSLSIGIHRSRLLSEACTEVDRHLFLLGAPEKERVAVCMEVRRHLNAYLDALLDAGTFATFERLFALWHIAHIPLFLFLAVTAIIHILAAHYF